MRVHVIENFLENPAEERARALEATYQTVEHNGLNYRGIAETEDDASCRKIKRVLFGDENAAGSFRVIWRRYLENEENETYIHNDCLIANFTAILFLNPPGQAKGGIAFWKYRPFQWHQQPTPSEIAERGLQDTPELWERVYQDGFDEAKWEMTDYVPMAFNRLVLFHSPRFHSRYPKQAFGTELGNSRLIKVFFFKCESAI